MDFEKLMEVLTLINMQMSETSSNIIIFYTKKFRKKFLEINKDLFEEIPESIENFNTQSNNFTMWFYENSIFTKDTIFIHCDTGQKIYVIKDKVLD